LSIIFVTISFAPIFGSLLPQMLKFALIYKKHSAQVRASTIMLLFVLASCCGDGMLSEGGNVAVDVLLFDELPEPELPPSVAARKLVIELHLQKEKALTAWLAGELEPGRYRAVMDSLSTLTDEVAAYLAPEDSLLLERLQQTW
jgi:hypothetical protein